MDGSMHRVDLVITNVTQPMAKHIRVRVPKALFRPVDPSARYYENRRFDATRVETISTTRKTSPDRMTTASSIPRARCTRFRRGRRSHPGPQFVGRCGFILALGPRASALCVCYQPEPPAPKLLRYRTIRIFESVDVTPSVRVTARTIPSPSHPLARIVRLTAPATNQTKTFRLNGVRLGRTKPRETYALMPLMKNANEPRVIRPGETIETLIKCSPAETRTRR